MSAACRRLYVGNLGYHVTQEQIREIFRHYGKLTDVFAPPPVPDSPQSHIHRGYMFVEFEKAHDAAAALDGLVGIQDPSGRTLKLREAARKSR